MAFPLPMISALRNSVDTYFLFSKYASNEKSQPNGDEIFDFSYSGVTTLLSFTSGITSSTTFKMRVIDVACVLYSLAGTAAAGPAVPVPEVSSVVSSVTASFAAAVLYTGPTGSASFSLKTSSTSKSITPAATPETAAVGATPYWLELIKHQGISAFKDFGAKGWLHVSKKSMC
jgi:hypothetical protein